MNRKKLNIIAASLFLMFVLQIPALAKDWPMFRTNNQRTGNLEYKTAKVAFTGEKVLNVKIPDMVKSSPAIFGNSIIFGSNNGNIYSLDFYSGKTNWSYPTGNWVVSSPAVADGKVF
ncbi:MAG: PQQ-binding-like beta-propeller repeat protein, partial [Synergistaceae bacterium]|nr:PQQ-binding-like beta-propeller repeat protein [Synergistaceae bacterium]